MTTQLKVYDIHGRLWISKPAPEAHILYLLNDLRCHVPLTVAYLKTGQVSRKIVFPSATEKKVSVRYLGSDGIITYTYPIRLSAQPVTILK